MSRNKTTHGRTSTRATTKKGDHWTAIEADSHNRSSVTSGPGCGLLMTGRLVNIGGLEEGKESKERHGEFDVCEIRRSVRETHMGSDSRVEVEGEGRATNPQAWRRRTWMQMYLITLAAAKNGRKTAVPATRVAAVLTGGGGTGGSSPRSRVHIHRTGEVGVPITPGRPPHQPRWPQPARR